MLGLLIIVGAAVISVMEKKKEDQIVMVYEENTVQKGSLRNEVTENGSVSFGIVSQEYELDLGTDEDDDDDEDEEEEKYLKIEEVYVTVGQRIEEGEAIYRFTEDSVEDVRKNLKYAKTEAQIAVSEAQTSYNLGVLYESALSKAQEELEECTDRLESFEAFVGDGTVYANGTGLITTVGYEEGDSLISAGTLISYAVSDAMTIEVDVAQEDVTTMKVGDQVSISFSAYEDTTYEGVIESITTTATSRNSATVSYPVTILIQGDTSKIYGGMTADVTFIIEEMQDVIYVPRKAIVEENGKKYVYTKLGEEYVLTAVTTGFTDGANVEILSGLQEGDIYYIASVAAREEKNDETR